MRIPARYPAPKYRDPEDLRLTQIIKPSTRARRGGVNIVGVPFDGAVLGRRGAAGGPAAIRETMSAFSNYNVELGLGLEGAQVLDLGDLSVEQSDTLRAHRQIEAEATEDIDPGSLLVILGGDNSVSLPCIRAASKRLGRLGLVVIDSHFDIRGEIDGKPTSGSSYGLAIKTLKSLDPRRVVEIGMHGFLNSKSYHETAEELGITVVTAREVYEKGPEAVARQAYARASRGAEAVYLSVDLDAVDIAYVSGVSAPSAGGISADQLFRLVYEISRNDKVKCADVVELAPTLDPSGRSARVAASAVAYIIAGHAARGRSDTRRR
ncbi:MAG: agmatinase family protein [Nitrososphaerota archaeon]|nr:agmatinase family protein [Nitrososphaerota archaeon]